jgi:glutaminase
MTTSIYTSKEKEIFQKITGNRTTISSRELILFLNKNGYLNDDPRWSTLHEQVAKYQDITERTFLELFRSKLVELDKTLNKVGAISDFKDYSLQIETIFDKVATSVVSGNIPKRVRDPNCFGFSLCTVDGQRFNKGDFTEKFCLRSGANPLIYAVALEEYGEEEVHKIVDKEPSGKAYNSVAFSDKNIPYNPMINSGAIMLCSMLEKDYSKFDRMLKWWERAAGDMRIDFNYTNFLFEKANDTKNHALAFLMKDSEVLHYDADVFKVLEFYFKNGCIELDCNTLAVIAGTLANGGICPITNERVFKTSTTRAILTLMLSCGLYEESGQFAFAVGTPACSSTNGAFMVVIPGVCGYCVYSPRINQYSNSIKGIEMSKHIASVFKYHIFDGEANKIDNVKRKNQDIVQFFYACYENDLQIVKKMVKKGMDINTKDYDDRTPLHIACSEGHFEVVDYLLKMGGDRNARDRWGLKPIDDAKRGRYQNIEKLLI